MKKKMYGILAGILAFSMTASVPVVSGSQVLAADAVRGEEAAWSEKALYAAETPPIQKMEAAVMLQEEEAAVTPQEEEAAVMSQEEAAAGTSREEAAEIPQEVQEGAAENTHIKYEASSGKYYLVDDGGTRITVSGTPQMSDGTKYWVDQDGYLRTGWLRLGDWELYFYPDTFCAAKNLSKIEDKWYLFDGNGVKQVHAGTYIYNGRKYWFSDDGHASLKTGWLKLRDWMLYFDPVEFYAYVGGAYRVGNDLYLFNEDGVRISAQGTPVINNKKYWFNTDNCTLRTGWLKLGEWQMYFDEKEGNAAIGVQKIGEKYYLFEENGIQIHDPGTPIYNGNKYWCNEDGSIESGWKTIGNWRLYFYPDSFIAARGFCNVEGVTRLFNDNNVMFEGPGYAFYGGTRYQIDADGVAVEAMSESQRYAAQVLDQVGWNLRAAFNWSAGLAYANRGLRAPYGSVHSEFYAFYGFQNHCGNCYVMASTFCQMARLLGYEAYLVEGLVPLASGGLGDHGWCEIVIGQSTYVFDPDFTHETGRNGYQIYYGMPGTWRYYSYHRVD